MDKASYLEHLQTIFCEFNANAMFLKSVLIHLFCNGLQTFLCAQAKPDGR